MSVALIGLPGSGKTTVGRLLAERLNFAFLDLDAEIERFAGRTIPELFAAEGEAGFRLRETAALRRVSGRERLVLAAGGGAVVTAENRELFKRQFTVVYLRRELPDILGSDVAGRPLLDGGPGRLQTLYEQRRGHYEVLADVTVQNHTPSRAAAEIQKALEGWL